MKTETKERIAFMAASMVELADMTESSLQDVIEVIGADAIRDLMQMDLMQMDHLRYESSHESMAEEICNFTGWDPMLVMPCRTEEELSRIGGQIADLVEDNFPTDEDAAESLADVLCWEGLWAWLAMNNE